MEKLQRIDLENLQFLDLSYNDINTLKSFRKVNLKNLRKLILDKNDIKNLEEIYETFSKKLEVLSIENNNISNFESLLKIETSKTFRKIYYDRDEVINRKTDLTLYHKNKSNNSSFLSSSLSFDMGD